jgi:hypothetical protein
MSPDVTAAPNVVLLHIPGCPHVDQARRLLRSCLSDVGLTTIRVEDREGDYPSPSIIVNGTDVMGTPAVGVASCRLDLPTRERVMSALQNELDRMASMSDHHGHGRDQTEGSWSIVGFEPIFSVADTQRSTAHYKRLGFTTSEHDEHDAFAERGRLVIHLAQADAGTAAGFLYIHVDGADVLAHAVAERRARSHRSGGL